jgi:hypothetical protein
MLNDGKSTVPLTLKRLKVGVMEEINSLKTQASLLLPLCSVGGNFCRLHSPSTRWHTFE